MPKISGSVVNIISDYGGEHKASDYHTISILYLDLESCAEWEIRRRGIRDKFLPDGRRLSFKALGDRHRQKALIPFLDAADEIKGVMVTFAIRKSTPELYVNKNVFNLLQTEWDFKSKWKQKSFENMTRVAHLVSIFIAGLSQPNQHIYWISDEDKLFANVDKSQDLLQMLGRFSGFYVNHPLGELGVGTTSLDEGDRLEEDLAAIPDLAAGAVSDIATKLSRKAGGKIPRGIAFPYSDKFSAKTEIISSWLADRTQKLQRVVIVFEKEKKGFSVFRLNW